MKGIGARLVLGGTLWGWLTQRRERSSARQVRLDILSALQRMGEEIRLARTPMPALLEAVASDCRGAGQSFFLAVAAAAKKGESVSGAWQKAAAGLPLGEEERRALAAAGQAFGGDEERLCRALTLASSAIQRKADAAEAARQEEEKRAAALWGCGGAMTVILLM